MNLLSDFRCIACNKLLAKQAITDGVVEFKCPRCGRMIKFSSGFTTKDYTDKNCTADIPMIVKEL